MIDEMLISNLEDRWLYFKYILVVKLHTIEMIKNLARMFDENNIRYHFDGSTSLFIHGMEIEMDDIDICFPNGSEHAVRKLFLDYNPTSIKEETDYGFKHFKFYLDGEKIHCLFYSGTYEEFETEESVINIDNQKIIYKSIEFYLRHLSPEVDLARSIRAMLEKNK